MDVTTLWLCHREVSGFVDVVGDIISLIYAQILAIDLNIRRRVTELNRLRQRTVGIVNIVIPILTAEQHYFVVANPGRGNSS